MKINMFEGGRRIAYLLSAIWAISWIVAAFMHTPYVSVTYTVPRPDATPIKDGDCPKGSANDYTDKVTTSGKSISITLCFVPKATSKGELLIPIRIDPKDGSWWGSETYSSEVLTYKNRVSQNFSIPKADEPAIEMQFRQAYWKDFVFGANVTWIGLAVFWLIVWTVGWIVRGFAGIPLGKDKRPE